MQSGSYTCCVCGPIVAALGFRARACAMLGRAWHVVGVVLDAGNSHHVRGSGENSEALKIELVG